MGIGGLQWILKNDHFWSVGLIRPQWAKCEKWVSVGISDLTVVWHHSFKIILMTKIHQFDPEKIIGVVFLGFGSVSGFSGVVDFYRFSLCLLLHSSSLLSLLIHCVIYQVTTFSQYEQN